MMKFSNKKLILITLTTFITLIFFNNLLIKGNAYNVNDDILLDMEVNGVGLDEAVSGQGAFPIGDDYIIEFSGNVFAYKGLTINYLEFVIKEAGFGIHQPVRIDDLTGVHLPADTGFYVEHSLDLAEVNPDLPAIIDQIRGTHELEVSLSYTLDGEPAPKEFVEETEIVIESEGFVDTVTTASGAATTVLSAGAAVATVGTASTIVSTFSYLSGKFLDDLKNLWKGIKTTKEVSKAVKKGLPLRAKVRGSGMLSSFLSKAALPSVAQDGGEEETEPALISLSSSEVAQKEEFLKELLLAIWDQKKCPECGSKWNIKKEQCKNKDCGISLQKAQDAWIEHMWPFLLALADLILNKKMRLKKAKKKLKVDKQKLRKKTVRQLAAILVQAQLIDVDWKSIVPLGKLVRSGLFIGSSIFLWLFLYGVARISPQNLLLSISVSIMVPLFIGLIMRRSINKKQKALTQVDTVEPEIDTSNL